MVLGWWHSGTWGRGVSVWSKMATEVLEALEVTGWVVDQTETPLENVNGMLK